MSPTAADSIAPGQTIIVINDTVIVALALVFKREFALAVAFGSATYHSHIATSTVRKIYALF